MKKLFISMCIALLGICASAQEKGDMAVGLNLGVAPCLESGASVTNFGIGAKFQYNVTNPIRLEAAFDYGIKDKGMDVMTLGVNGHYLIKVADKLTVYPLIGFGYARLSGGFEMPDDYENLYSGSRAGWDWDIPEDMDYGYPKPGDNDTSGSASANKFFFNVGVGAEYALNSKLSLGIDLKYQYIQHFNRLPINISLTYKF